MSSIEKQQAVSLDSTAVASRELVSTTLDGEVVILGFESGAYFGLDGVGAFVWDLLQAPHRVSDIRDAIIREYEVDLAQCERDLLSLLEELASRQLIDVRSQPDT